MKNILAAIIFCILSVVPSGAQAPQMINTDPSIETTDHEEKIVCSRAHSAIKIWKEKLRLQAWSVEFRCGIPEIFIGKEEGLNGASEFSVMSQTAVIWMNPKSTKPAEAVMIHELLHLVMADVIRSESAMVEERTVWMLADLIYKESR